ncbi:MAG: class I SAM-dependent methyltransferase [Methanobacterium sp.]
MTEKHGHKHHGKSSREILNAMVVLEAITPEIGNIFLDAGCGDGYISIAASNLVGDQGKVYALDVYPESIETVKKEIKDRKLENVDAILADITNTIPLDSSSIDIVLMANVLHGFVAGEEVGDVMSNIVRLLKPGGIFAVVEFRKLESSKGPPFNVRISPEDVSIILKDYGFDVIDSHEIGEYHYIVRGVKK